MSKFDDEGAAFSLGSFPFRCPSSPNQGRFHPVGQGTSFGIPIFVTPGLTFTFTRTHCSLGTWVSGDSLGSDIPRCPRYCNVLGFGPSRNVLSPHPRFSALRGIWCSAERVHIPPMRSFMDFSLTRVFSVLGFRPTFFAIPCFMRLFPGFGSLIPGPSICLRCTSTVLSSSPISLGIAVPVALFGANRPSALVSRVGEIVATSLRLLFAMLPWMFRFIAHGLSFTDA